MKQILKHRILLLAVLLATAFVFQDCHLRKNKCDGCPGYKKKVRRSSKGSI
ncbi:MAG: hypothetical protein ACXVP0_07215 [Bacteroidia bacterium]